MAELAETSTAPTVTITSGAVRGKVRDGVSAFLGIPYAAPPVDAAAFAPPGPVQPWEGVRDATAYGPTAPQVGYPAPIAKLFENAIELGDDYLNVNVWTPDPSASGLPVMVWIHGGAFARGSNRVGIYSGETFARDGVVFVGINYRLGVPGFASVDGAPENRGLLDQIAALTWVQQNVAAFGGDPARVTIFGESAGAMSVASLMSSPLANGLFHRAIMQSGNGNTAVAVEDARKVTARLAGLLGVSPDVAGLGSVSSAELLKAQTDLALEATLNPDPEIFGSTVIEVGLGIMTMLPVVDSQVLPNVPEASIAAGAGRDIPLIAGWNADEFRFFLVPTGVAAQATPEFARGMIGGYRGAVESFDEHLAAGAAPGDALCMVLTDIAFRSGTLKLAELRPDDQTYIYEFGVPNDEAGIGAGHAVDIPYVFDHLEAGRRLIGPDAPQAVADAMHSAWVSFAKTGDPGWGRYLPQQTVQRFD
ncbi:putative carboxylesterase [Gordonia araii NBRC 100433]|uniref:Carboxylic ester hydrolase n=1 Tax=Gordonia araii NBRC 100433 TaxID=1073574 RepID=G7H5Y2_9ACTN|nr:carboxylesterase family protein [Gordonia araii]NNG98743.1 carboxylesterase family protein [Gordonia araii NBRC 100433]GAB11257.1 putative carboxylesterase [Gordonia araii NBRC 100433]